MSEVQITGMRRVAQPKPNKAGFEILAFFECDANGFHLRGCAFVRTPHGGFTAWPPKVPTPEDEARRAITFRSDDLRRALITAASETYRALGGEAPHQRLLDTLDSEESPAFKRTLAALA